MEVRDIFELRRQGRIEEAYEAIRPMYAVHKGKYTTLCMFWTAHDILRKRLLENKSEEAVRIFQALLRLVPNIRDDKDGRVHEALMFDALRLNEDVAAFRMLDFLEQYGVERLTETDWKTPPQPCLAQRLLDRAFAEIGKEPTVDNALKAMPLLTENLKRNPKDKQGLIYKEKVKNIIVQAEQAALKPYPAPEQPAIVAEPAMPLTHNELGRWGEEVAVAYLEGKGYRVLERDWHSGHRDIDIIARNVDCVIFIEVKTRRSRDFGEPYEAVNYQKRRNLLSAINHYIRYKRLDLRARFDVISIVAEDMDNPEIQHIEDIRLV